MLPTVSIPANYNWANLFRVPKRERFFNQQTRNSDPNRRQQTLDASPAFQNKQLQEGLRLLCVSHFLAIADSWV